MCALVSRIAAHLDIAARPPRLRTGWAPALRVLAAIGFTVMSAVGCAKGQTILEDEVVYLDPRRPTPTGMDASAEAGLEPPIEVPPDDAAAPPPDTPLPAPDSGSPSAAPEAGADASAASDGG